MSTALDYLGITTIIILALYTVAKIVKVCYDATKNSPEWQNWWQKNGENAAIDASAWVIGLTLSGSAIAWRDGVGANLFGIGALNTGVALLVRASVPTLWVWGTWMSWRLQFTKQAREPTEDDAREPMRTIEANKIVPALNRGIIAATVISTLLAGNEVQPNWLDEWWVMIVATTFGCNWTTKIESTFQPMALWHKFTENKYRS